MICSYVDKHLVEVWPGRPGQLDHPLHLVVQRLMEQGGWYVLIVTLVRKPGEDLMIKHTNLNYFRKEYLTSGSSSPSCSSYFSPVSIISPSLSNISPPSSLEYYDMLCDFIWNAIDWDARYSFTGFRIVWWLYCQNVKIKNLTLSTVHNPKVRWG